QVGQSVVECVVLKSGFGSLAVGDVAVHDYEIDGFSARISYYTSGRFKDSPAAILMPHSVFNLLALPRLARLLSSPNYPGAIVGMNLLERRCHPQLFGGIPEHTFIRRTVVDPAALGIYDGNQVSCIFGDDAKHFLPS